MSKPFAVPLPEGIDGLRLKFGESEFLLANCDKEGLLDLPAEKLNPPYWDVSVGVEVPISGNRMYAKQTDCHYLYALICEACDKMYDQGLIHEDTYTIDLIALTNLARNQK